MPPKPKAGVKATKALEQSLTTSPADPEPTKPTTVAARSLAAYYATNPAAEKLDAVGILGLDSADLTTWANAKLLRQVAKGNIFSNARAERDYWKVVQKDGVPFRNISKEYDWGVDSQGRKIEEYSPKDLEQRFRKTEETLRENLQLSLKMEALDQKLYGAQTLKLSEDPEWEDVPPIPAEEPEGALAAIAYPAPYAEATAYLRIVMSVNEMTRRTFRLTAHLINLNPAHYTVWLYRFKILQHLQLPIEDEIIWLNDVSLQHLKNYQIWHHRQLLIDAHYPTIASDAPRVAALARSETAFIAEMLEADSKNYHVWSYRQWLVRQLGMWEIAELLSVQNYIEEDLRNNSAWSHRFFIVFSNPNNSSGDAVHATEADPKVPNKIIERELKYARDKIELAPQNPSAWNYLKGVLVKAGRGLHKEKGFVEKFVQRVGEGEDVEEVQSTHALDILAEIHAAEGEKEKAAVCLMRLSEKWDPIREGYWKFRKQQLVGFLDI